VVWRKGSTLLLAVAAFACSGAQQGKTVERGAVMARLEGPAPLIRLARAQVGACPGRCPTYAVEVDVAGGVSYEGVVNVKTIGPAVGQLSTQALEQLRLLMVKASRAKFPTEKCACGCVKDAPVVTLTTWSPSDKGKGAPHTVTYDKGCERTPHATRVLEEAVDDLVGIDRWIGTIQQRRLCFEERRDCSDFGTPEPPPPAEPDGGR
jgi:hypothetical protein